MTATSPASPLSASTSAALPDSSGSGADSGSGIPSGTPDTTPLLSPTVQWGLPDAVQHPATVPVPSIDGALSRPKPRAGRRPGAVWNYFTPVRTEQNKTHAVCGFCARRCAGVAARMVSHLLTKCPAVPTDERDTVTTALTPHEAPQMSSPSSSPPPEKRQRIAVDSNETGLAAFGGDAAVPIGSSSTEDKALAAALPLVVVACLRVRAPLTLVEDAFFRDALVLLRPPQSLPAIKELNATALRETVRASVTQDHRLWMSQSASVTLVYSGVQREWRGADTNRHSMLLADATESWRPELETQLQAVGPNAVVGFCSDARHVYGLVRVERAIHDSPLRRIQLLSKCLLTETLRLWTLVLDAIPQLAEGVTGAADKFAAEDSALLAPDFVAADWRLPFRVVKRLLHARGDASQEPTETEAINWTNLEAADALLSPFAWLLVLSESKSVCSSQFMLCWLWLLATTAQSPLLAPDVSTRNALVDAVVAAMASALEDHHVVAFLLDPRTRGAGLSPTGRRKAKSLVATVAARLWPTSFKANASESSSSSSSSTRQALLSQLSEYLDKTGCFADEVVWEMAEGATAPEKFWKDYVQDAPQLSALATAVLTFAPLASQTSELMASKRDESEAEEPALDARQIRFHFERNRPNGDVEMASVLLKDADLVASSGCSVVGIHSATATPVTFKETVLTELERLRAVTALAALTTDDEASSTGCGAEVDATWFAYASNSSRQEMDAARRRLLPMALLAQAALPPAVASPSPSLVV